MIPSGMAALAAYLFTLSLLLVLALTPLFMSAAKRWGVVDRPGPRKIHAAPIPLIGGWSLFAGLSLALWGNVLAAWLLRDSRLVELLPPIGREAARQLPALVLKVLPLYAGACGIFALGLIDDLRGMAVRSRLWAQTLIAVGLVAAGLYPNLGFLPPWCGWIVGVLWIVGITNAFNFLDGLDGLSAGIALSSTVVLATIMTLANQPNVLFLLAALSGSVLGFLRYNVHPARAFLGSSGSLLLGYLLAAASLLITYMPRVTDSGALPILAPIFVLAVPLYDTSSVVLIRLLQKRSIAIGDQSHFHHRLLRAGFSHGRAALFIVLVAFAVGLSGVRLVNASLAESLLIISQIAVIFSLLVLAEHAAANRVRASEGLSPPADPSPERIPDAVDRAP